MSEHVRPYAEDYQQVLDEYPDMHPDLATHIQQLAEQEGSLRIPKQSNAVPEDIQPSVAKPENFALTITDLPNSGVGWFDRKKSSADEALPQQEHEVEIPGEEGYQGVLHYLNKYTEGVGNGVRFVDTEAYGLLLERIKALPGKEYLTERMAGFLHALRATADAAPVDRRGGFYRSASSVLGQIPTDTLQDLYFSSPLSEDLHTILKETVDVEDDYHTGLQLELLMRIYDCEDPLDMIEFSRGRVERDQTVEAFLNRENAPLAVVQYLDEVGKETQDIAKLSNERLDWARRYLDSIVDLPANLRDDALFYAYNRLTPPNFNGSDPIGKQGLGYWLEQTTANIKAIGIEAATELHDQAGIIGYDYHKPDQLQLLTKVLKADPETIKHLNDGDVTLVLMDTRGDYSGAMRDDTSIFATPNKRTLFFEIGKIEDFEGYMKLLQVRGISPSTVVLSAHGEVGRITYGKSGQGKFAMANHEQQSDPLSQAHDQKILITLNKYMKDSRGIDDPPEARGRRRFILASCMQANPVGPEVNLYDTNLLIKGRSRLLNRFVQRRQDRGTTDPAWERSSAGSLAKALPRKVDVYAAEDSINAEVTAQGFEFYFPDNGSREKVDARHFRKNLFGKLKVTSEREVVLRQKNAVDSEAKEAHA